MTNKQKRLEDKTFDYVNALAPVMLDGNKDGDTANEDFAAMFYAMQFLFIEYTKGDHGMDDMDIKAFGTLITNLAIQEISEEDDDDV